MNVTEVCISFFWGKVSPYFFLKLIPRPASFRREIVRGYDLPYAPSRFLRRVSVPSPKAPQYMMMQQGSRVYFVKC